MTASGVGVVALAVMWASGVPWPFAILMTFIALVVVVVGINNLRQLRRGVPIKTLQEAPVFIAIEFGAACLALVVTVAAVWLYAEPVVATALTAVLVPAFTFALFYRARQIREKRGSPPA
ncbi:MAG: hypothetical protein WD027_08490 [Gaiellales bacterium]